MRQSYRTETGQRVRETRSRLGIKHRPITIKSIKRNQAKRRNLTIKRTLKAENNARWDEV